MTTLKGDKFDRALFESVIKRRFFFTESFEIYRLAPNFKGDNRGLFDYGPPGCSLQANIIDLWRKHFVLEENMLEVDCTVITPEAVLKTSGHVDKFADWMCKDPVKGDHLRADHLVENVLETRLAKGVKGLGKDAAKLSEAEIAEYNNILAQVSKPVYSPPVHILLLPGLLDAQNGKLTSGQHEHDRSTTTTASSSGSSSNG